MHIARQDAVNLLAVLLASWLGVAGCQTDKSPPIKTNDDVVMQADSASTDTADASADTGPGGDTIAPADDGADGATASSDGGADVVMDASADAGTDAATDAKVVPPGPRSSWSPQFPGIFYGCSSQPAESECFIYVHPLPEDLSTFVKACDDGEKLHPNGCPGLLEGEQVVATCQDFADPVVNTGFAPYMVYVVYEGQILQSALDVASPTETAVQACERLIKEFKGTFCPVDSVIEDIALSSIDCNQLK